VSFIDKALEKSKLLQHERPPEQGAAPGRRKEPVQPKARPPIICPVIPGEDICYTYTQTVPVDRDKIRRARIIIGTENDLVSEKYKYLRTQILQRTNPENLNTLMVTGSLPGEGKTITAINLAISISQEVDTTVLLVDLDLRHPSVHEVFGLPPEPGLVDHLVNGVPIPDLLVHPEGFSKLVILPAGKPPPEASELISSPMMANLVQELKHFYPNRYVIFDLPPVLAYTDPIAFGPFVDGIIMVVEENQTPQESLQESLKLLKGMPLLGFVLNKVNPRNHHSHYYYKYNHKYNKRPSATGWLQRWFK
jgi:protein-tyrosine kinase